NNKGFNNGAGYGAGGTGSQYGGGGGGSYGTKGANGSGASGNIYGEISISKLFLGSSGGDAGTVTYTGICGSEANNNIQPCPQGVTGPEGSRGGGIVLIAAQTIDFAGTIIANGENSRPSVTAYDEDENIVYSNRSGAGSGGSIRIEGETILTLNVEALGGTG